MLNLQTILALAIQEKRVPKYAISLTNLRNMSTISPKEFGFSPNMNTCSNSKCLCEKVKTYVSHFGRGRKSSQTLGNSAWVGNWQQIYLNHALPTTNKDENSCRWVDVLVEICNDPESITVLYDSRMTAGLQNVANVHFSTVTPSLCRNNTGLAARCQLGVVMVKLQTTLALAIQEKRVPR